MGGSSKQTIGYKYRAGMMVAIGNRIEKVLDINPDNRGWILTPEQKKILDNGEATININQPNLFGGSNGEGGWVGSIDVKIGKDNQKQNEYLANQIDEDISAYPNLSYLTFRGSNSLNSGFDLVSMSGMLKDFMLLVKRIHVNNNGDAQWYDEKSEIGRIYSNSSISEIYRRFPIVMNGQVSWDDASGFHAEGWGTGRFPFFETQQSYHNNGRENGPALDVEPSAVAVQPVLVANGIDFDAKDGTIVPPTTWTAYPPDTDGAQNGVIVRHFYFEGYFNWRASEFDYKAVISGNNAGIIILKKNEAGDWIAYRNIKAGWSDGFSYVKGKFFLETGTYKIGVSMGERYLTAITPRPFVHLLVKYQATHEFDNPDLDINPIHKIREILTDDTAMNKSESLINDSNFIKMANRIWDEGLGISWCIQEKSCKDALDELCYHIDGGLRINRQTGLYEVILFRDDMLNLDTALKFNESNIKTIEFDIANMDESISSINVSYYDRRLIKNSSFLLYENGLQRTRGFDISDNVDFPYFMNRTNAEKVGNWKLKQLSSPTWKGTFKTGIVEAREINKYDVIKLSWLNKNLVDLPVRVMNINLGDGINNTVTIEFVEVTPYSNIEYPKTEVDYPIDTKLPPQPNLNTAFEMPYFEAIQNFTQTQVDLELSNTPEIGYLMASAQKPQNNSLNAVLYTDGATNDSAQFQQTGVVNYCPAAYLDQVIGYTENVFKVKDTEFNASKFTGATSGTWIILNNEIMVYESFNELTNEITVKRGALDTVPHKHTSGTIFFSDEFSGLDSIQYIQGEDVKYQVLTTTPSSIENIDFINAKTVNFNARPIRPYPPANVKINGEYYPDEIETDLVITWVDRNRLQQTGGDIIGWFDGGITIENDVTYVVELYDETDLLISSTNIGAVNTTTVNYSSVTTATCRIKLYSIRDGYKSQQAFEHTVIINFNPPYNLHGDWDDENKSVNLSWSFDA